MSPQPSRWLIIAAFAAVYLIWGSSYIGIHFAVQTIPPFLMSGARFLVAGVLLIGWAIARGTPLPTRINWRAATIAGMWLFLLNNGGLVWAEANGVPSGVAAVLIATVPMWIVVMMWLKPGGAFPGIPVIVGLVLGFIGIILLLSPEETTTVNPVGIVVVLLAAFCWAVGSLYVRTAALPQSSALSTGMQLFCGGVLLLLFSAGTGEIARFDITQVTSESLIALVYLAIMSSIVAFSAFVWLMRVASPTRVATYAYVNPVIAVFLGWLLASEKLEPRTLVAAAIIISAVVMINGAKSRSLPRLRLTRHPKPAPQSHISL